MVIGINIHVKRERDNVLSVNNDNKSIRFLGFVIEEEVLDVSEVCEDERFVKTEDTNPIEITYDLLPTFPLSKPEDFQLFELDCRTNERCRMQLVCK